MTVKTLSYEPYMHIYCIDWVLLSKQ